MPSTSGPVPLIDKWFRPALVAITLIATLAWITFVLAVDIDRLPFSDARNFHLMANGIADGAGYVRAVDRVDFGTIIQTAEYPPLFSALLALGSLLGLDSFRDHQLIATVLAVTVVPLTGLLGRRVAGPAVGLVAAMLAAAHPMLFQTGPALMSEAVYPPLVVAVLLVTIRAVDTAGAGIRSTRFWALAGLLCGVAALGRGEGLVLGAIVTVTALVTGRPGPLRHGDFRRSSIHAAAVVLALAVVIVPWSIDRTVATGGPVLVSANQQTVLAGANCPATYTGGFRGWWAFSCFAEAGRPGDNEADRYGALTSTAVDFAFEEPAQLPGVAAVRALRVWGLYDVDQQLGWEATEGRDESVQRVGWAYTLALVPLAGFGLVQLRRRRRPWVLLAAMPAMVTFTAAVTYGNERFRIAAEPALAILAAVALVGLVGRLRSPRPERESETGESETSSATEPRNRRLEGMRAVAALSVMGTHLGFASGATFRSDLGAYFARMDIGVAIFFVLSGFLLYRPFVRSRLLDQAAPRIPPYLWRRFLRIVPAYWVALAAIPLVLGIDKIRSVTDAIVYGGFLQIYDRSRALGGITQAWSLCTEISFYLALPVFAWGVRRIGRQSPDPLRTEVLALGGAYALSVAFRVWLHAADPSVAAIAWAWLPANADLFALGMAVAVIDTARSTDPRAARIQATVRDHGRWCWVLAAIAFWVVSTRLGLPRGLEEPTALQELLRQFLYGSVGLLTVLPLALGARRDRIGQILGTAPMVWLGVVSYGIYIWHLDVIGATTRWLDTSIGNAGYLDLVTVVLPVSVLIAAVSWYLVEHPLLRFRDLGRRRTTTPDEPDPTPSRALAAEEEVVVASDGVPW